MLGVALVLLAGGGLAVWGLRSASRQPLTSRPAPAATTVPSPPPATPPVTATLATDTALTTIRPVWVRVIADGDRVIERELPADARVPFAAKTTIVIRTGDAGAVRLSIAGQDQGPLGRDGEVVTRTFTVSLPERK